MFRALDVSPPGVTGMLTSTLIDSKNGRRTGHNVASEWDSEDGRVS